MYKNLANELSEASAQLIQAWNAKGEVSSLQNLEAAIARAVDVMHKAQGLTSQAGDWVLKGEQIVDNLPVPTFRLGVWWADRPWRVR